MFAIIRTGGKQYRVQTGDILDVEKLNAGPGQPVAFDQVLLIDDDADTLIGAPLLEKALVKAEVLVQRRDDKILVFKKKRRKQFRRTRGHRQALTRVRILSIYADQGGAPLQEFVPPTPPSTPVSEPGGATETGKPAHAVKEPKPQKPAKAPAKTAAPAKAQKVPAQKAKETKTKKDAKKAPPAKSAAKPAAKSKE